METHCRAYKSLKTATSSVTLSNAISPLASQSQLLRFLETSLEGLKSRTISAGRGSSSVRGLSPHVFPNKPARPHYALMSLKTPSCTSIFSSDPIMRSHPLPPSSRHNTIHPHCYLWKINGIGEILIVIVRIRSKTIGWAVLIAHCPLLGTLIYF